MEFVSDESDFFHNFIGSIEATGKFLVFSFKNCMLAIRTEFQKD